MKLTGYEGAMNKSTDEQGAGTVFVVHPSFGEALKFWLKLGFSVSEVRPGKFPSCTRSWLGKNAE